jgi:hypothetical protein
MRAGVSAIGALVSTANLVVFVAVGVVLQVGGLFGASSDVPLWYFAVFALLTILVLAVTWPKALRMPPGRVRMLGFSLRSGVLLIVSLIAAVSVFSSLLSHNPERTLYGAGAWPEWVCLLAAALAFVRFELDPSPVTLLTPLLTRVPDPTRTARVLSVVSVTAFLASIALSIVGGLLQLRIPAAALWIQPVVLLIITLASLFKHNRWLPTGGFANIRAVTPVRLGLIALASVFVQLPLAVLISHDDRGLPPSFYGTLVLLAVFVIGMLGSLRVSDDGPTKRGKRPRGAAPLTYVGKLPQVAVAPVPGWVALPSKFPADGYQNATAWATGMLPRFSAEIGGGTDEQKHAFARSVVTLTNSRLKRSMGALFLRLEDWEGPFLVAGLIDEFSQPWQGMPVHHLDEEIAGEAGSSVEGVPLTTFTTASGLEGHKRLQADRVDYWVTVDGGWAHLSCNDEPNRVAGALPQLDALASAIFIGDRVVGRRKQPVS